MMEIITQYWSQIIVIIGVATSMGYFKKRIESLENNQIGLDLEMSKLKDEAIDRNDKVTIELTNIKVALARIETILEQLKSRN